jgi:hypothetical protein
MRRSEFGLYVGIASCLGFGLLAVYFGYFGQSTVCDPTCRVHPAGAIDPLPTFGGALFFLIGVYLLVKSLGRRRISRSASVETRLEVSAEEQAKVACEARTHYTQQGARGYNPASPSEFDLQMLSLLDSIEVGAGDIDEKIEALRSYVRHEGLFQRWRDKTKANYVWQRGASSLQWVPSTPETWQLRCNWNRLLRIVGRTWGSDYTIAPRWIRPDLGQPSVGT